VQRVVVALVFGTGVRGAPRRPQRLQDRGEHRGAPGGQVAGEDPGPGERGLDPDLAVFEGRLRVIVVLGAGQGAGVDLGGQRGQVLFAGPAPGGGQQDPVGRVPAGLGELVGPAADQPGHRLRHHRAVSQRRQDLGVGGGPAGPAQMPPGRALGHLGAVDQPGGRAVVRIRGVAVPGGERGQHPGPDRGLYRVELLQGLQAFGPGLDGHHGGVGGGQVVHPGPDHGQRLGSAGRSRDGAHLTGHLPGRVAGAGARLAGAHGPVLGRVTPARSAKK
jgi:hypothetical protein